MKAKLYIDSEDSTIKVEGGPSDVLHLLVCAIAQILKSYFPDDFERQMGWALEVCSPLSITASNFSKSL